MADAVVVRYKTRPGAADENQRLVEQVFAELAEKRPDGVRYASFRLDDGVTFVHVVVSDGTGDPLGGLTAFAEFQQNLRDRIDEPPVRSGATVVGSYP